jgi:alkanesulfonate monooxygenase SsuD/methylene tetrahydromethanopterin reductase-like flavin-dependent oxidoreductase (luciferase family)
MWSAPAGEPFSFDGRHYRVIDSPALPKPVQIGGIPIIVGGTGPSRTPALAARFADEYNAAFRSLEWFVEQRDRVTAACDSIGRDSATLTFSTANVVCLGSNSQEFERRAGAIHRAPDELRENGFAGTPDDVLATLERWQSAGADRIYLQVLDLNDLDHLDEISALAMS